MHADHLSAARYLRAKLGGACCISAKICEVQEAFHKVFAFSDSVPTDGSQFDRLLYDGEELTLDGNPYEQFAFINRAFGPYAWAYWIMISCNVITPQLFWIKKFRTTPIIVFVLSIFVNIGMWFERFVITVTSLHHDFLPSSWAYYSPTFWDVATFLGSFGLFFTMFALFVRFVPQVAMAEVKTVMPIADAHSGERRSVGVQLQESVDVTAHKRAFSRGKTEIVHDRLIEAPISAGDQIATLVVTIEGKDPIELPLVASEDVPRLGFVGKAIEGLSRMMDGGA